MDIVSGKSTAVQPNTTAQRCTRCGHRLQDPASVAAGMGPDCREATAVAQGTMTPAAARTIMRAFGDTEAPRIRGLHTQAEIDEAMNDINDGGPDNPAQFDAGGEA